MVPGNWGTLHLFLVLLGLVTKELVACYIPCFSVSIGHTLEEILLQVSRVFLIQGRILSQASVVILPCYHEGLTLLANL